MTNRVIENAERQPGLTQPQTGSDAPQSNVDTVPYIQDAECVRSRLVKINGTPRERQTWFVKVNDTWHTLRKTAAQEDAQITRKIYHLPGFTEVVDAGTAYNLHNGMAEIFPEDDIVTIATDGMTKYGKKSGIKEGLTKSFGDMAEDRIDLMRFFNTENDETILMGVSMGTVIGSRVAKRNLERPGDRRTRLDRLLFVSQAHVEEHDAPRVMIAEFLPHMAVNGIATAVRHPKDVIKCAGLVTAFRPQHLASLGGNLVNLLKGVHFNETQAICKEYPISIVTGGKDPLLQQASWDLLVKQSPDNVTMTVLADEGHSFTLGANVASLVMRNALSPASKEPLPQKPVAKKAA